MAEMYSLPLCRDVTEPFWLKCLRSYTEETRLESPSYYGRDVLGKKPYAKLILK